MDVLTIMNSAPSGSSLLKALKNDTLKLNEPKSAIIDPTNVLNYTGTRIKPAVIPMQTLRSMSHVPAISAIIQTRLNQVARFARQPRFEGDIGFKIVTKDIEQKMSPADKKEAKRIAKILLQTGAVKNRIRKDNFDRFIRKVVRDSLVLDQMCWENVPAVNGQLSEIWALDAATIELVVQEPTSEMYELPVYKPMTRRGLDIAGEIAYVQRVNGQIIAEYSEDELAFAVRNPYTDINLAPFGRSELEDIIEIVTGIVNGVRYNTSYFSESHLPQGVLELIGTYSDESLEGFKRMWRVMTSGAGGKWAVPIMAMTEGHGFKWTAFKNSNRDMEFNEFMEFLFNIACAVYQIDPNEVGFKSWTSKSGGISQSDNTEAKIEQSQDKGFVPLMTFVGQTLSSEVIDQLNDEFCLAWEGLDDDLAQKSWEKAKEELEAGTITVNEYRASKDREPIKESWGDAPANPQLIQVFMADKQAEQQQQQMGMQGDQQMQQLQAQHGQNKEMAELQHNQAKDLAQMQQQHELAKQAKDQQFQKEEGSVGRWHEQNMADDAHGKAKEMAKLQHSQAKDLQKDSQQHDLTKQSKDQQFQRTKASEDHERAKELQKDSQKHDLTKQANVQKHDFTKQDNDHKFQRAKASEDHERAKELAQHADSLRREGAKQDELYSKKSKKNKLQKSLSDIYLADNKLIERLAEQVHKAWMRVAGTSDNPDMKPYKDLHEAVKETDRATARAVIEQLVKEGIIPDEDKLKKAIETAEFQDVSEGTIMVINPWETY